MLVKEKPNDKNLLGKYHSFKEIFNNESYKFTHSIIIRKNIKELNNINIDKLNSKDIKLIAKKIFKKYNDKNIFINNGNKIIVTNRGIEESINKIFNSKKQRAFLKEHLQIFSCLGKIIAHAKLVGQTKENKNRKNIVLWSYYFDGLIINNEKYYFEFDVRTMDNGQNQYRVQRLETTKKIDISTRGVSNKY